ncbi:hypothetical protein [Burkholderia gladioli]|uniref:hypothetical protein n=1 Tax=Burkholderia gladioli TaxID=28095 RepID=UPI00163F3EF9|nr:hypothetical protein [Burkholderia gladioli]
MGTFFNWFATVIFAVLGTSVLAGAGGTPGKHVEFSSALQVPVSYGYGVDHCAFLSSERDFARLIDAVRTGRDLGPVPFVGDGFEEEDEHPDMDAMVRAPAIAQAVARRAGIGEPAPAADQPQQRLESRRTGHGGGV